MLPNGSAVLGNNARRARIEFYSGQEEFPRNTTLPGRAKKFTSRGVDKFLPWYYHGIITGELLTGGKEMAKEIVTVKLEPESIDILKQIASIRGVTRSEVIRELVNNASSIFSFLEVRRERLIELDGELTELILKEASGIPPELVQRAGMAAIRAAQILTERAKRLEEPLALEKK